jgi:hypothetical protein
MRLRITRLRITRLRITRLRITVLVMVLTGSTLTGAVTAPTPAGAATNPTITIRAIDREGKQVPVTASLQTPPHPGPGFVDVTLTSAHSTRVPRGLYNIAAWVVEPGFTAQTLVDRAITITKSVTVTFDARKGKRIQFAVNDPTVAQDYVLAEPFTISASEAFDGINFPEPQPTYAVPGRMAPGYYLALQADLTRPNTSPSPVEYQLYRVIKGVIPANLTFTYDKAKLASDQVTVKEIDPGARAGALFRPLPLSLPAFSFGQSGTAPFSVDFHFTPGYAWESSTFSGTDNLNSRQVLGVRHYTQTFDNAVFGPSPSFGPDVENGQLQGPLGALFIDPTQEPDASSGTIASLETWLYEGTKLLAHKKNGTFSVPISATPHWYTIGVRASRGPGATLWRTLYLSYHFQDWSQDPAALSKNFWPRIIPRGLSLRNAAAHGTRTTVPIWFTNAEDNDIGVSGVRVWASADGGKTWYALRVSRSGLRYTVVVRNQPRPGFVSLRVQGTDANGATATETVINAYRVS